MLRLLLTGGLSSIFVAWFFLLLVRLPLFTQAMPLMQPELNWMLVGERLSRGFMLYTETWDSLSPLSAGVYALVDWAVGRSAAAYHMLAFLLVMFQSAYFSFSLRRHNLYNDRTHLPALLYCLCASLFYDYYTLSPVLLGLTFLLIALNALFAQLDKDNTDNETFGIGFYIGMATLFYIPFGWFVLLVFAVLLLLSALRLRKFLLLLFGFGLPLGVLLLVFYLMNAYDAVYFNWIAVFWERRTAFYTDWQTLVAVTLPLGALLVMAATQLAGGNTRFINYQIRCQQAMFLWLLCALLTLFFADDFAPYVFLVFVPPAAFFGTYFFLLVRKPWMAELGFWMVLALVLLNGWGRFYLPGSPFWKDTALAVQVSEERGHVRQKRLLVIGRGMDEYRDNTPATPYLNWRLARRHFENLNSYPTVVELYGNFTQDPPDVIVDKQQVVPRLFERLPALASQYERGSDPNVYYRKSEKRKVKNEK